MFTYFHCYLPETWQGQVDRGFIDEHAGIRYPQNLLQKEEYKFNTLAVKGGDFWKLVESTRLPMYIDRLQGGGHWEGYSYDMELVNEYKKLLGDKFYGFQMHEWMNNFRADIRKLDRGECTDWTVQNIKDTIFRLFPGEHLFLEARSAEEYAAIGRPATIEEFLERSREMFLDRFNKVGGDLIPTDSSSLSYPIEIRAGVRHIMAEIGAQTPDTRIQIAFLRGLSRAHHIDFGAYIEPWGGGHPVTTCCYHREGLNEWGLTADNFPYKTSGANGGSSRSMQKRMQIYAYFAGASFMSEEWGMCNTFYDWKDFEVSPYGQVKLDFLKLVKEFPDAGNFYAPIGLVVSKDLPVLPEMKAADTLYQYPVSGSFAEKLSVAREGIRRFLSTSLPMVGTETISLINSSLPDAFDILQDDCPEALGKYEYLVNLTGDRELEKRYRCVSPDDVPALLDRLMPVKVEGNLLWFLNKTQNGWYLVILNNDGIRRTPQEGESLLPEGNHSARISLKNGKELKALYGEKPRREEDGSYTVEMPSGSVFIGAF